MKHVVIIRKRERSWKNVTEGHTQMKSFESKKNGETIKKYIRIYRNTP